MSQVDRSAEAIPLYQQVARKLMDQIQFGVFEPGERLPSIRALSRQMRVSVNTVREAYTVLEVPSDPVHGVSLEAIEFALQHHPVRACLLTPNFANPLGSLMPADRRDRLRNLLSAARVPLIQDDIYGDLYFGAERPQVIPPSSSSPVVVLASSFSKTIAPGYRCGWVAAGGLTEEVRRWKTLTSIASASPPALAVADLLESGGFDRHLRKIRRGYRLNMQRITEVVSQSFPQGTRITQPSGGMVLWLQLPAQVDAVALYYEVRAQGISFAPGPLFSSGGGYRNCLRLTAVSLDQRREEALRRIGETAAAQADAA